MEGDDPRDVARKVEAALADPRVRSKSRRVMEPDPREKSYREKDYSSLCMYLILLL